MENASYGLTVCAERVALWTALNYGYRKFQALALVADASPPVLPCGSCRQVLWELAGNLLIIAGNLQGEERRFQLADLLPEPFAAAGLKRPGGAGEEEGLWRLPVSMAPIGYVENSFLHPDEIPGRYKDSLSRIILRPDLEEGLYRLEEEERIIVIGYLHQARGYTLKEERRGRGNEVYGVFACRSPRRPNPVSLSVAELVRVEGSVLTVRGLDLINGTPVLDIKTVMPRENP